MLYAKKKYNKLDQFVSKSISLIFCLLDACQLVMYSPLDHYVCVFWGQKRVFKYIFKLSTQVEDTTPESDNTTTDFDSEVSLKEKKTTRNTKYSIKNAAP